MSGYDPVRGNIPQHQINTLIEEDAQGVPTGRQERRWEAFGLSTEAEDEPRRGDCGWVWPGEV